MEQLTKNQAVATSQEAVQNQNEPQLRDENAHNDKSVHGVLNPTYQAGLRPSVDKQASHFVHIPGLSYSGVKSPTECQQSLFESHFASRQSLSDCPVAF